MMGSVLVVRVPAVHVHIVGVGQHVRVAHWNRGNALEVLDDHQEEESQEEECAANEGQDWR